MALTFVELSRRRIGGCPPNFTATCSPGPSNCHFTCNNSFLLSLDFLCSPSKTVAHPICVCQENYVLLSDSVCILADDCPLQTRRPVPAPNRPLAPHHPGASSESLSTPPVPEAPSLPQGFDLPATPNLRTDGSDSGSTVNPTGGTISDVIAGGGPSNNSATYSKGSEVGYVRNAPNSHFLSFHCYA